MAYNAANLHRLAGGSGVGFWKYVTTDTQSEVGTAGYFDEAANMLNLYDIICVAANIDSSPVVFYTFVNANSGSTVDVVNGVAIPSTDTN